MTDTTYKQRRDSALRNPAVYQGFKDALTQLEKMDPLNAVNAAEYLADLMRHRLAEFPAFEG